MSDDLRLTLAEGVTLAHVLVDRIAREANVRTLLIKGPILELQGLREPRQSSDVDVWCDPAAFDSMRAALEERGWQAFNEHPATPQILRSHALTFIHERWPCNLDLHHWFPGFYADPQHVFDVLWSRRSHETIAHQPVTCTDRWGSAMVGGLHLLRSPELVLTDADTDHLVNSLRPTLDDASRAELARLVAEVGASATFAPILDRLGVAPICAGAMSGNDMADWAMWKQGSGTPLVMWLEELRRSRLPQWPAIIWRGLTFDPDGLWAPDTSRRSGVLTTIRVIGARLIAAIRHLPRAARAMAKTRGPK